MDCGSYREIVLLEHAVQVLERVHENRIRQQVQMDVMHFGFIISWPTFIAYLSTQCLEWNNVP